MSSRSIRTAMPSPTSHIECGSRHPRTDRKPPPCGGSRARTLDGAGGVWVQADRGALPAQAVFLVGSERDGYHAGEPANDARFIAVFAHALEHTGGYAPEEARRVAGTLLPDVLSTTRGWVTNARLPRHADVEHQQPQRD